MTDGRITQIIKPVIWYEYKGDEICWNGKKFVSLLCEGEFDSLNDMDVFWEEYDRYFQRQEVIVTKDMAMDAGDLSLEGQIWQW